MPSQRYTGPETEQGLKGSQGHGSHLRPHLPAVPMQEERWASERCQGLGGQPATAQAPPGSQRDVMGFRHASVDL